MGEAEPDDEAAQEEGEVLDERQAVGILHVSPKASFVYFLEKWKTYHFRALLTDDETGTLQWDFGDGVTSAQKEISHTFRRTGSHSVSLSVTDREGNTVVDTEEVEISFFHLANPYIQLLIALLVLFILTLLAVAFKKRKRKVAPGERIKK